MLVLAATGLLNLPARSAPLQPAMFTLIDEDDDFARNGDQHYTQGLRLSYFYSEQTTPQWAETVAWALPDLGMKIDVLRFGVAIGQNIYTPKNLMTVQPIMNDRPYAGWLYAGLLLQRQGMQGNVPALDSFEVDFGLIGPQSMAGQIQCWWHTMGGWNVPEGWDNQLKIEPAMNLRYERQWKFSTAPDGFAIEAIPYAGFSLGNVNTSGAIGTTVRFGYNIPDDFGVQTIDSLASQTGDRSAGKHAFGIYCYGGAEGRAVAHNAFLDGNLFRSCVSVDKEPLVADLKAGVVLAFRHLDIAASVIYRTREFEGQQKPDRFASISLNMKF